MIEEGGFRCKCAEGYKGDTCNSKNNANPTIGFLPLSALFTVNILIISSEKKDSDNSEKDSDNSEKDSDNAGKDSDNAGNNSDPESAGDEEDQGIYLHSEKISKYRIRIDRTW